MATTLQAPVETATPSQTAQTAQPDHPRFESVADYWDPERNEIRVEVFGAMLALCRMLPDPAESLGTATADPVVELERLRAENAAMAARLEARVPAGQVTLGPRCNNVGVLHGSRCGAFLAVAVGPGTIIDCPRCRKRHEW